ncbi:MAG: peroxiredoxin family protein [Solirubrobacteraceae bacterium]
MSESDQPAREVPKHRLDPDRAAAEAGGRNRAAPVPDLAAAAPTTDLAPPPPEPTQPSAYARRYRSIIGIIGLGLVIVFSVLQFVSRGVGSTGVPPGQRLHFFAAPLAASTLNGAANLSPPCTIAGHDPRALNICLLAKRGPLVLAFYVTGSGSCQRQVDALQAVSRQFSPRQVQFAALAVGAGHAKVAGEVRSHRWTVPVAYDSDGRVGALYGLSVCPLIELSKRGGVVADRLIGDHWLDPTALAAKVRALLNQS